MANSLRHQIRFSPSLAALLILVHATAASVVHATALPATVSMVAYLLILASLTYYLLRDVLLRLPNSWREIALDQQAISVAMQDGSGLSGRVERSTVVNRHFVVLSVTLEASKQQQVRRVIFPDAMRAGAFRELCVHLRFA